MVNIEQIQLTSDPTEEHGVYVADNATALYAAASTPFNFAHPVYIAATGARVSAIEVGSGFFVCTEPTPRWVTIYPSTTPEPSLDFLEDLDVPLPPKRTREMKGVVIERRRASFATAFSDDIDLTE